MISLFPTLLQSGTQPFNPRVLFILLLIWLERSCFRAKLRADLEEDPNLLRDIGISLHEAKLEATRPFWEPVILTRC
jgi:uncharacterized protein YjiS (DUF1127 family)